MNGLRPDVTKPLQGQVALVTGASRGIGAATAVALAAAGAHVILTARTSGKLEEVEERIHADGGSATIAPLDLVDADGIAKLADAVAGRWAALDMLVLNAAMLGSLTPVQAIDAKEFGRVRVAIVDPGATATQMRARAFPGEDPASIKNPSAITSENDNS